MQCSCWLWDVALRWEILSGFGLDLATVYVVLTSIYPISTFKASPDQWGGVEVVMCENYFLSRCGSGEACVSLQRVCDGLGDCSDGSDEAACGKKIRDLWSLG